MDGDQDRRGISASQVQAGNNTQKGGVVESGGRNLWGLKSHNIT